MFPKMLTFSRERHGDEMRDSGKPYFSHIIDGLVIMMCFSIGSDILFTAYAAHDLVENGKATLKEVKRRSCREVATLVDYLDKSKKGKRLYFLKISLFIKAIVLKAINRLSNMSDMFEVYKLKRQ